MSKINTYEIGFSNGYSEGIEDGKDLSGYNKGFNDGVKQGYINAMAHVAELEQLKTNTSIMIKGRIK